MSYDLELLFLSALPINIYIFIQIIYLTNNSLGRYFLREIDIQNFSLFTFLLRLTLVTSSRVFPTTVVVVVVLVAGVEPAVEMATPLELLLILDDDDEDIGG